MPKLRRVADRGCSPDAGFADRLLVRIARLLRPFRLAIGWAIYLTLVMVMFVESLMPVWWPE
ncbi:hypothetical protein GGQ65_004612 [Rhizobium fabae]|uniref:Uncharacterized protein n=1 Tax=Rhizobium fabae TaxID=573179 RepID=A0A7W6BGX8_9HYPH|nr:hypothetical protein [Rhizobium fabae]